MKSALLLVVLAVAFVAGAAHAEDVLAMDKRQCGAWVEPVAGYRSEEAGLTIALPANDRLMVDGHEVAASPDVQPWVDTANKAYIGRAGDELLIETVRDHCDDGGFSRYYVLRHDGSLRAVLPGASSDWRRFIVAEGSSLVFWSQSACWGPPEPDGLAAVHVLKPGADTFVREDRPVPEVCSDAAEAKFRAAAIQMTPMTAIAAKPVN
jgi:hypothetical protein